MGPTRCDHCKTGILMLRMRQGSVHRYLCALCQKQSSYIKNGSGVWEVEGTGAGAGSAPKGMQGNTSGPTE